MGSTATTGIELGTVVAGRYRVEQRLGEGGMGAVYRVEHVHTGQQLALKVLNPKLVENAVALERFRREARAPARIESDHVVKVTDADVAAELGGAPFLVMDLLRGETFEELLSRRGALPVLEALAYLRQIARALDKAHDIGIVHRDIKPENLFLTQRDDGTPCVKLLDFGIAKLGAAEGAISKTATGEILGTPLYMSPEQTLAKLDEISPQTDIWALGVISHKLLTGTEPWTAETLPHLIAQIAYEPLPVPSRLGSGLGPGYDVWFSRCCAREPSQRYARASEAVAALSDALGAAESEPVQPSLPPPRAISARHAAHAQTAESAVPYSGPFSDTLAAQVAPRKRPKKIVLLAAIGGAAAAGIAVWITVRTGAPSAEPRPSETTPVVATRQPPEPPLKGPPTPSAVLDPVVAPTVPAPVPALQPQPTASAPAASAPAARPTIKPIRRTKTTPIATSPSAAATAPAPTPSPTRDPLGGRH